MAWRADVSFARILTPTRSICYKFPMPAAQVATAWHIDASRGRAVVAGTDIKVSQIASEVEYLGMTPDEVIDAHPHLTLAAVHAALAYYYDHQDSIRAEWEEADSLIARLREKRLSA